MKVVIINKSDSRGGAAVVSMRLLEALREVGVDARMLVAEKTLSSPYVEVSASPMRIKRAFLAERLKIFRALGYNRENLFKIDIASDSLPLASHRWVREADVVCLNWVNQGMLSFREIERIHRIGKPIVWTMHDMWCMTGICHHAGKCNHFQERCGECPLLGERKSEVDLSSRIHLEKSRLYRKTPITFVAVSSWLAEKAHESSLLAEADLQVIPNAFNPGPEVQHRERKAGEPVTIIMGAARLDDPIKGLPILVKATELLASDAAHRYRLLTYGSLKDPHALDGVAIPHENLGYIGSADEVRNAYSRADIVVSSSLYETLPGTLVEGQAWGCVPVSFNRGGQKDIIDHKATGYIADYDDDIDLAATNLAEGIRWAAANLSDDMSRRMRESVLRRFSAEVVATAYLNLFREICTARR